MPQLDASSFPSQLFWLAITFVLLYAMLSRLLLPRVHEVLAKRAGTVEGDVANAARMKAESEGLREQYEKALAESRVKVQAMLAEAQAQFAADHAKRQTEADKAIERQLAGAEQALATARADVTAKLAPAARDLAAQIVEVVIHQTPDAGATQAVVDALAREQGK